MACSNSINVSEQERLLSMFGAGLLTACGLLRGSATFLTLGAGLAYRGYTGHCHVYEAIGHSTAEPKQISRSSEQEAHSRVILSE